MKQILMLNIKIIGMVCFLMLLIAGISIDTRYQYQQFCVTRHQLSVLSQQYRASQLLINRTNFYQQQWSNQFKNLPSQTQLKQVLQLLRQQVEKSGLQIHTVSIQKPVQHDCGDQKIPIRLILAGHYAQFLVFLKNLNINYVMLNNFTLEHSSDNELSIKIRFFLYTKAEKICVF